MRVLSQSHTIAIIFCSNGACFIINLYTSRNKLLNPAINIP